VVKPKGGRKNLHCGAGRGILDRGDDSVFERIEGEHSLQQDLAAVNPNLGTGKPEYALNCGDCIVAYEMRRRGFDVEAMPRKWMHINEWKGLFEGFMPDVRRYFDRMKPASLIFGRLDNLKPAEEAVINAVKNKGA
jgi:hypothetical protein